MINVYGIICLLFMCVSILFSASKAIVIYPKKQASNKPKDVYNYLFDVYGDS